MADDPEGSRFCKMQVVLGSLVGREGVDVFSACMLAHDGLLHSIYMREAHFDVLQPNIYVPLLQQLLLFYFQMAYRTPS